MYESIWDEPLSRLRAKGYEVKKGVIQDATFMASDPGRNKSYFGYKGHIKEDTENYFIWIVKVTFSPNHPITGS